MFTDIVASTDHAARLGDRAWTALLDRHDAAIERELLRFRGRRVNTTGDGILAIFDGPARGVRCAQAITTATRELGLDVRVGLHAGEVEHRGGGVSGIAVHIGQRISSLAGPGEILVSRTVADLVAGSSLQFEDRGEHRLKGVPNEWRVYAVTDTGV
jgi:class 3 adenylate cyclase